MFSTLGGVKKREPVFTFKRKIFFPTVDDSIKKPVLQQQQQQQHQQQQQEQQNKSLDINRHTKSVTTSAIQPSISSSSSSSSSTSTSSDIFEIPKSIEYTNNRKNITRKLSQIKQEPTKDEETANEDEKNDNIFDFPDSLDNFSEIKVMVASTRAIPEAPKLVRKRSKSKNRTQSPSTPRLAGANATVSRKRETYDINQYKQQIEDMCPSKKRVATLNKKPASSSPAAAVSKATSSVNTTSATITTTNTNITTTTTTVSNSFMDNGSSFIDNSFIVNNSYNYNQPQQVQPFDIFAFDPAPTSHITYNMNAQAAAAAANFSSPSPSTLLPALPFQSTYYPNTATMYNTNIYNDNIYNNALQSSFYLQQQPFINNNNNNYNHTKNDHRNMSANNNQLYHSLSTASILNGNSTITSQYNTKQALQKPTVQAIQKKKGTVEKRPKKLNLVAHLKGANGEKENHDKTSLINKEFDFLSDEEDMPEQSQQNEKSALSPLRDIINTTKNNREPSLSPELTYAERMELELEAIMKSEFEGDDRKTIKENELETKETIERRPRYQPLNKVNVRVTFQKPAAAATTITNHQ